MESHDYLQYLIENNNHVNVDNLNKENKEVSNREVGNKETGNKEVNEEVKSKDETDNQTKTELNQKETAKIGLFKTSKSSNSIQHPLNTSESNSDFSQTATLISNLNLKLHLKDANFREAKNLLNEPFIDNQNASPNSTTYRQSILTNFNDWITSISTGSLFQNFLFTNPFRRKPTVGRNSASNSPNISRSNSRITIDRNQILKEDSLDSTSSLEFENNASCLIGTLKPTLKGNELIELANFGVIEIDSQEPGLGHRFEVIF